MSEERTIDRIRKLLRLSKSPNPHEAALAMERAAQLAMQNNIALASVDPDEQSGGITSKITREARLHFEKERALILLQKHFNVNILRGQDYVRIIGREVDISIAEYAYTYIVRACRSCLKTFTAEEKSCRRTVSKAKKQNFIWGFMKGIDVHLTRLRVRPDADPDTTAVIHATQAMEARRRKEYLAANWESKDIAARVPEGKHSMAATLGFLNGSKTTISRPVADATRGHSTTLLLI